MDVCQEILIGSIKKKILKVVCPIFFGPKFMLGFLAEETQKVGQRKWAKESY